VNFVTVLHSSLFTIHFSSFILHPSFVSRRSSLVVRLSSFVFRLSSFVFRLSSFVFRLSSNMSFFSWFVRSVPRAPRRAGFLMHAYYLWQEYFTPAGKAAAAFFPLSMVLGMVPGFWAAWVFCGLDFLLFLGMILSLFCSSKLNFVSIENVVVTPAYEGEVASISAEIGVDGEGAANAIGKRGSSKRIDSVQLASYRMDPSLTCEPSEMVLITAAEGARKLECRIQTKSRGAYPLKKIAANIPEIMGLLQWPFEYRGFAELLVYPRPIKVGEFPFLTSGASGMVFAPLLMPSLNRGMNFVGVREYREGDALRDLHHKAFARYGKPFTKEFETERGAGAILVLDTATPSFGERQHLETAIRLTAGIGLWLLERNILGRFFIDDEEIPLAGSGAMEGERRKNLMDALARIPAANLISAKRPGPWSPAARPMDPVLRVGLFAKEDPLMHKHVVVGHGKRILAQADENTSSDKILFIDSVAIKSGVSL